LRGDDRPGADARHVGEPGRVEVADVHEHAELRAAAHEGAADVSQPRAGVGRRREAERDTVTERAGAAPHQPERANAGRVPRIEGDEVDVDRLGALEVQDEREHAVGPRAVEVGHAPDDPNTVVSGQRVRSPERAERERRRALVLDR
jgi:hypothetical protein